MADMVRWGSVGWGEVWFGGVWLGWYGAINNDKLNLKGLVLTMLAKFKIKIKGTVPILMHSTRTANPLDSIAKMKKEITSKHHSKKTEDDMMELAKLEFIGSCYWDDEIGYYIPSENLEACIKIGAMKNRNGKQTLMAVSVINRKTPLKTDAGKTPPEELVKDADFVDTRFVVVNNGKILRTRPRFERWEAEFEVHLETSELSIDDFVTAVEKAGIYGGLGDYRPKYGRFEASIEQIK